MPRRLEQVVVNLLTNAIKYSDKEGQVWLAANRDDANITISLKDAGIGMGAGEAAGNV